MTTTPTIQTAASDTPFASIAGQYTELGGTVAVTVMMSMDAVQAIEMAELIDAAAPHMFDPDAVAHFAAMLRDFATSTPFDPVHSCNDCGDGAEWQRMTDGGDRRYACQRCVDRFHQSEAWEEMA